MLVFTVSVDEAGAGRVSRLALLDWHDHASPAAVQQALGGRGAMQPGDVLRFGFPRSDLQVAVDGVAIRRSWTAFKRTGANAAMVMADLVLTEDEVNPVMLALQQGGIEQTALHDHVLLESPRVMYVHITGSR